MNKSENETGTPSILIDYCYCSGWPVMIDLTSKHISFGPEPIQYRRADVFRTGIAGIGSNIPARRELNFFKPVNACHHAKGE